MTLTPDQIDEKVKEYVDRAEALLQRRRISSYNDENVFEIAKLIMEEEHYQNPREVNEEVEK